jgi:hypothetical protein
MACLFSHNGKTYTKEELIDYLKNNPISATYNVKPDFSNINEIIEQIANEPEVTEKKVLGNQTIKRLNNLIQNQIKFLQDRILEFQSAKERKGYLPKEDTINRLKNLKEKLSTLENVDAFTNTADFIYQELGIVENFLDNTFDVNNENHINFVLQIRKQLESYKEFATFLPEMSDLNSDIKKIGSEIDFMYKNTQERVEEILEEYMINFVKTNTKRNISKEDIKKMLDESKDISWQETKMGGLSNSMDPLLQLLQRHVEKTREEVYENTNNWIAKVKNQVNKLKKAGIEGFEFMFQKTKDGKRTGRILQRVNEAYYKDRTAIFNILKDAKGDKREYIYKPGETLSEAEKQHNLKFSQDKKKVGAFLSAETADNTGVRDGENHKYSDEFKQERSNFEKLVTYESGYSEWVKKPFVPGTKKLNGEELTQKEYDRLYTAYKRKYYTELQESFRLKGVYNNATKQNDYDGTVERIEISRVKPEYVEVVTEINNTITKYADKQYHALMNDKTPAGIARKEFFEFYKNTSNELLDKLPLATKQKMQGKMFRIRSSIAKDIKSIGVFNTVKKSIRQYVNPDVIFTSRELDEEGNMLEDVPIFYTGELKSNRKIEQLNKKLEELRKELQTNAKDKSLANKIKMTKNLLLIEESKLTPDELELDMGKSLIKAAQMAENYDLMKQAEATLLIAKKVIEQKNFFKLNAAGQKEIIRGIDSNVNKRINSYMRMIFYSNSTANQDKISKLIQNFNSFVAYKSLGLNPFSAINNTVMAKINNRIEGFGAQFGFTNKHLNSAIADTAEYIRSLSYMKNLGKDEYLLDPSNKFEAMLKKFNWLDRNQIIEDSSAISKIMFMGITGGEFIAQSNTAIAKLRSQILTNSKTGEKLSIWEAHEFVNGELKLKDGFEYSLQEKRSMSVDIKNMNKIIHGNYSENDKVALQEHALGQSAMQFKKWAYNFAKSRWGNTYFDESSGDYQEGRYRTFANFITLLKAGAAFDFNAIKNNFESLEDYQKSNLKKFAAESIYWATSIVLMLLLEGLSKGIDDDDEELKMFVNFLRKQSDRVGGELDATINPKSIYSSIKNPVAGLRTVSDFSDVLIELIKTPFNLMLGNDKDIYIEKGPNKGMTKLYKESRDIFPVGNLKSQFDNLLTSGNFFIRAK